MVALEALEALRNCEYLKEGAIVYLNDYTWHPIQSTFERVKARGETPYVSLQAIREKLQEITPNIFVVDCKRLAIEAGNPLTTNSVLLGMLGCADGFPLTMDDLQLAMSQVVPPNTLDSNLRALMLGYENARSCLGKE